MTLILTELSSRGITMAADSAVTVTNLSTGLSSIHPEPAKKLHIVPYLRAGIACWGAGRIENIRTDLWLSDFISRNTDCRSLGDFSRRLADKLNSIFPRNPNPSQARFGVHLAGYEKDSEDYLPSFYHIHDGHSEALSRRNQQVDPAIFNPNHDITPSIFRQIRSNGGAWITRNGDFRLYAEIFSRLEGLFRSLDPLGIRIPHSIDLDDRAEYLVFQIRMVAEIYRMSNLVPGIGGEIRYLTINTSGVMSEGVKYQ